MRGTLLLFVLLPQLLSAQKNYNKFVDFHIHTSFKHFYKDFSSVNDIMDHRSDTAYLTRQYGLLNWKPFVAKQDAKDRGRTSTIKNYNQSDFSNLVYTPGSIFCTSLYPYEKQFALTGFNKLVSNLFVSGISLKRLKNIGGDDSYPLKEFLAEYTFLSLQKISDPNNQQFKIELARDHNDLMRILKDENASAQVISIEGGQVLYGPVAGQKENVRGAIGNATVRKELLDNIDTLRMLPHKVFFITMSHFTDNMIAGFSKTIDRPGVIRWLLKTLSTSPAIRRSFFTKFGEGIHGEIDVGKYVKCNCPELNIRDVPMPYTESGTTDSLGKEIYRRLLKDDSDKSRRILVDVKHMDIQARFEYYAMVKELNKTSKKPIPIIAGHVAVSGEKLAIAMATGLNPLFDRYEEVEDPLRYYTRQLQVYNQDWLCRTKNLKPSDREKFFLEKDDVPAMFNPFALQPLCSDIAGWFYPWSINLCDEEIKIIYESEGIIGLNFDERIQGGRMLNYSRSYKSQMKQQFDSLNRNSPSLPSGSTSLDFERYMKSEPLIRNILHIVNNSGKTGKEAWSRIAIGSDFDGLIDPIDICPTAENIPAFHKEMVAYIEIFWSLHRKDSVYQGRDLFFANAVTYAQAMDMFFFENGRDFILKNF